MWSHAVTAARRVRPAVQVLGPSTSSFSLDFLRTFLSAANASNTTTTRAPLDLANVDFVPPTTSTSTTTRTRYFASRIFEN